MNAEMRFVLAAALIVAASQSASAGVFVNDTRYVTCAIRYSNGQTAQYTSIAKIMKPALPVGTDRPNTIRVVNAAWRSLLIEKSVKFHDSYCLAGDSIDILRKVVANYELRIGYSRMQREEIAFAKSWPILINRVFKEDRVTNRTVARNQYVVEAAGSVGANMQTAQFSL